MSTLQTILQQGENESIEFKSTFSKAVIETLVAFANTKGGFVYVGVTDEGKITGADISKENIQRWQYPLEALRELVLNMIVHRDYRSASDSIVKIFPDHIQFFNPGVLPDTITLEQLQNNKYISTPRNRQIAMMFKEMGQIEKYGTGIRRVCTLFANYGLPLPEFSIISGGFMAKVYCLAPGKTESSEKSSEIIALIKQNANITIKEMAEQLQLSTRMIEKYMAQLSEVGTVKRKGGRKSGHWKVTE